MRGVVCGGLGQARLLARRAWTARPGVHLGQHRVSGRHNRIVVHRRWRRGLHRGDLGHSARQAPSQHVQDRRGSHAGRVGGGSNNQAGREPLPRVRRIRRKSVQRRELRSGAAVQRHDRDLVLSGAGSGHLHALPGVLPGREDRRVEHAERFPRVSGVCEQSRAFVRHGRFHAALGRLPDHVLPARLCGRFWRGLVGDQPV